MPTSVQRLKIFEVQSSTSRAICYCLKMVEFKVAQLTDEPISLALHGDECDGLEAGFIRHPNPNSLLNCARLLSARPKQEQRITSHHYWIDPFTSGMRIQGSSGPDKPSQITLLKGVISSHRQHLSVVSPSVRVSWVAKIFVCTIE
jgi:hypothetical protein